MTSTDEGTSYYIRVRGRVLGPYTVKQLVTLRARGQFSQSNEISLDREIWQSAATIDQVFKAAPRKSLSKTEAEQFVSESIPTSSTAAIGAADSSAEAKVWYFSVGDKQDGPISLTDLRTFFSSRKLGSEDRVWQEGFADWRLPSEIAELNGFVQSPARRGGKKSKGGSQSDDGTPSNQRATHFLDYVLKALRGWIGASDFATAGVTVVEVGRYAVYASIVMNLIFCFMAAVKLDSVSVGMAGIGFAAAALVLQYSAIKLCDTITLLIRATTLRMSSTAFIDSLAVLMLIGGVMALGGSAYGWMRTEEIRLLIVGVVIFIACEQLALMSLHPDALGITITDRATSGEEAIAILSFFLMLPLRFVSGVFGIGCALSVAGTCWSLKLLLEGGESIPHAILCAFISGEVTLACAIYPLCIYVYFVFAYLFVDVIRSVLVIPDKIDQVKRALEPVE